MVVVIFLRRGNRVIRNKEKRGEIIADPVRVKAFNFRVVKGDMFPDCCLVCTKASLQEDWTIYCNEHIGGNYTLINYQLITNTPKIWHVCDRFIRNDKSIFEK